MTHDIPIIRYQDVSKHYGRVRANDGLDFSIARGSIHALVGENGAGKSTAMKLLFGMERRTAGQIFVNESVVDFATPKDAMAMGIGMVHQHFMLSPVHSALDNVLLGSSRQKTFAQFGWMPASLRPLDRDKVLSELETISKNAGFQIPWNRPVSDLAVGVQQQIEIMKLLYAGVGIMIFDEPTAVLSPLETETFLEMLKTLKDSGKTIIIITHKLKEVLKVSDRVTVMRAGKTIQTIETPQTTVQELADLMVGREVHLGDLGPRSSAVKELRLKLKNVSLQKKGKHQLSDISLEVRSGEIVGIAGVEGNGQVDLLNLLYDPKGSYKNLLHSGAILDILGDNAVGFSARKVRAKGVGVVGADRQSESVLLSETLYENDALGHLEEVSFWGWMNRRVLKRHTRSVLEQFDVRPPNPDRLMAELSGGNQQKFVIGRELTRHPMLLLCAQPTRGVDVGSIEQIHQALLSARESGTAILLVSSQLEELMQLADRIVVMAKGRITAEFQRSDFDERRIGRAMLGGGV